jgi:hypothetical protein
MTDPSLSRNAFSEEYRSALRERDAPEGPWTDDAAKPLVVRDLGGRFGLFHPWEDPGSGAEPAALFASVEEARLALVARAALRKTRYYRLRQTAGEPPGQGYAVLREGEVAGALRLYEPEWVEVMNVVAVLAQSPENLAAVLDLAGPTTQEEVGEILGLAIQPGGRPGTRGEDGEPEG